MTRREWSAVGAPAAQALDEIAGVLRSDGVVVLPTDTIYGLHARAASPVAVEKVFALKRRDAERPLIILASSVAQLREIAEIDDRLAAALGELWPAPLSAILTLRKPHPAAPGKTTIAARVPSLDWMRELLAVTGALVSTSANRTGEPPAVSPESLPEDVKNGVDGILNAGVLHGDPSTLVDFTADPPRVVRQGEFVFSQFLWKRVWKTL